MIAKPKSQCRHQRLWQAAKVPKISIGMPVYNGESSIGKAIDSLKAQTFVDFELIISDNASTDGTETICRKYAAEDKRIRYVRQKENHGAIANFQFVLDESEGDYFMWAAADDFWLPDFLTKNLAALSKSNRYVGSISRVEFVGHASESFYSQADTPLLGTMSARMKAFLSDPSDNSRFYSLYRRTVLTDLKLSQWSFHAVDWLVVAIILKKGELTGVNEILMKRKVAPVSRYLDAETKDNKKHITFGFPLIPLTFELFRNLPLVVLMPSIYSLMKLNLVFWLRYRTPLDY